MTDRVFDMLWVAMAALSGSIISLAFTSQQNLAWRGKMFTIFIGFTFSIFVGPAFVRMFFGDEPADSQLVGALYFVMSISAMTLIPMLINALSRRVSSTIGGLVKPEAVDRADAMKGE